MVQAKHPSATAKSTIKIACFMNPSGDVHITQRATRLLSNGRVTYFAWVRNKLPKTPRLASYKCGGEHPDYQRSAPRRGPQAGDRERLAPPPRDPGARAGVV